MRAGWCIEPGRRVGLVKTGRGVKRTVQDRGLVMQGDWLDRYGGFYKPSTAVSRVSRHIWPTATAMGQRMLEAQWKEDVE